MPRLDFPAGETVVPIQHGAKFDAASCTFTPIPPNSATTIELSLEASQDGGATWEVLTAITTDGGTFTNKQGQVTATKMFSWASSDALNAQDPARLRVVLNQPMTADVDATVK